MTKKLNAVEILKICDHALSVITNTIKNQITFVMLNTSKGFSQKGRWRLDMEGRKQKINLFWQLEAQKLFSVKLCGRTFILRNLFVNPEKYVNKVMVLF